MASSSATGLLAGPKATADARTASTSATSSTVGGALRSSSSCVGRGGRSLDVLGQHLRRVLGPQALGVHLLSQRRNLLVVRGHLFSFGIAFTDRHSEGVRTRP